ncbi:MAG: DUF6580 family putative transport protein [Terriglobales bacterium]
MSYLLLLVAMAAGVLPHLGGLSPAFGGMLYGGARLRRRDALWLPLALMAALYAVQALGIYHSGLGWGLLWTTVAMIPMVAAGEMLRQRRNWKRLGAAAVLGSTGFYVLSNFAVWWSGVLYPHTAAGLAACYLAAVPFYGDSIAAGILFGGFLFAVDAFLARRQALAVAEARG